MGMTVSAFGPPLIGSAARQAAVAASGAKLLRIPVAWDAAAGHTVVRVPHSGEDEQSRASTLIARLVAQGFTPYVLVLGATGDLSFSPDEAAAVVRELAPLGVRLFEVGNEPDNKPLHLTVRETIQFFNERASAMRAVAPEILVGGPDWSRFDPDVLRQFVRRSSTDFLVFHQYAMGTADLSVQDALTQTARWSENVATAYAMLDAAGKRDPARNFVLVGETGWSWRYEKNAVTRGNMMTTSPVVTAWAASVLGHTFTKGGRVSVYADQNGPLGVFSQDATLARRPVFWALAAWATVLDGSSVALATSGDLEVYMTARGTLVVNKTDRAVMVDDTGKNAHVWSEKGDAAVQSGCAVLPAYGVLTFVT